MRLSSVFHIFPEVQNHKIMPWNPQNYNQFKELRYQPFFDLIDLLSDTSPLKILDLGCGTGELTQILANKFQKAEVLGIDSSEEMLAGSKEFTRKNCRFEVKSIEDVLAEDQTYDIIVSNAALQWVDEHEELIPAIIRKLNPKGQLAIQMPCQVDNRLNQLLLELTKEEPFVSALNQWRRESPVLSIDRYSQLFFSKNCEDFNIYQKVYPIIAQNHDTLYDFIGGSSLIPYMDRLDEILKPVFKTAYQRKIADDFTELPAIYAFKRLLMVVKF